MDDLPDDFEARLAYRIAFGESAGLAEIARFDHGWGRDFAAGIGSSVAAIEHEVTSRCSPGPTPTWSSWRSRLRVRAACRGDEVPGSFTRICPDDRRQSAGNHCQGI
jgi:hypothetical protein